MAVVSVVGAGPVGLETAIGIRENGFDVEVLEEHAQVGKPVACTGLIQKKTCKELKLDVEDSLVNTLKGARLFSPGKEVWEIRRKGVVANMVNRFQFDKQFQKRAEKLGIPIHTDTKLIDIRKNALFVEASGRGELRRSQIVVGADGAHSLVRGMVDPAKEREKQFIHAIQVTAQGDFDPDMVEVHLGDFAPDFFAWITPESKTTARVGLGAPLGSNIKELLDRFTREQNISMVGSCDKMAGLIPIGPPMESLVQGNLLLAGDAGFVTKATTGGGIMLGLKSAQQCSAAIVDHLKNKVPLTRYNNRVKGIKKDLEQHWKVHSYINSLSPSDIDALFRKGKNAGIESFLSEHGDMDHPTRFMGKFITSPRLWGLLGPALKILL